MSEKSYTGSLEKAPLIVPLHEALFTTGHGSYLIDITSIGKSTVVKPCSIYSFFLVNNIAIVNIISTMRILSGSMTYSSSIWMSISQGVGIPRSANTTLTMEKARMPLITIRIPLARYAHLGTLIIDPFPMYC
jgi:hypothetical protein